MVKHKVMIYQRKVFKILKYPDENNGLYLIGRTSIIAGLKHYSEALIPKDKVIETTYLKAKT